MSKSISERRMMGGKRQSSFNRLEIKDIMERVNSIENELRRSRPDDSKSRSPDSARRVSVAQKAEQ